MKNHKDKLRIVIEEHWETPKPEVKERDVALKPEGEQINDVIGPRRAGKTYLMYSTINKLLSREDKEAVIYINFENRKLFPLSGEYFNALIEIIHEKGLLDRFERIYVFLDEVQKVKDWERYLRSIHDEFKGSVKVFVSGSTSKLTKSKLSHLLTGRHLTTLVLPLSFKEFLEFRGVEHQPITEKRKAIIEKHLRDYLRLGGFPEAVLTGNEEIIETLFLDVLNRDIIPKARHREIVEDTAYFLCSYAAKLTSFSRLSKIMKSRGISVSVPTLERYFWLMKDSFLFFDTQIFSYKVKDQLQYPRKIYCIDNGFINYFGFKFSEDRGRMMENCVAVHLFRKSFDERTRIFYWKSRNGEEVDFVLKKGLKIIQLMQSCWDPTDYDVKERETKALIKASKQLKCNKLSVITWDYEAEEKLKGKRISFIPLWKWLLDVG